MPIVKRRGALRHVPVFLLYLLLAFVSTLPGSLDLGGVIIGDATDSVYFIWDHWWFAKALAEGRSVAHTDWLFYPLGTTLLTQPLCLTMNLAALPFRFLFGGVAAYNLLLIIVTASVAFSAYFLALRVTGTSKGSRAAAFVGGICFGFSSYMQVHALGHLELLNLEWLPLFALALLRLVEKPTLKRAGAGAAVLALAAYTSPYILLMCGFLALTLLGCELAARRLGRLHGRAVLAGLALFAVLVAPLSLPTLRAFRETAAEPAHDPSEYGVDPAGFFLPPPHSIWWSGLGEEFEAIDDWVERHVYLGVFPLLAFLLCLGRKRRQEAAPWIALAAVGLALSLGSLLRIWNRPVEWFPLPYGALLKTFPLLEFGGVAGRNAALLLLSLSMTAALVSRELLLLARSRRGRQAILVFLSAWVYIDNLCLPYPHASLRPALPVYERLAREPGDFAVADLFPFDLQHEMQYLQTIHGKRLLEGFVSRMSPENLHQWDETPVIGEMIRGEDISGYTDGEIRRAFEKYRIRYLLVHPGGSVPYAYYGESLEEAPPAEWLGKNSDSDYIANWGRTILAPGRFREVMRDENTILLAPPAIGD